MRHNHITRDIKPRGICPGCDEYYAKARERVEEMLMGDPDGEAQEQDDTDETA